MNDKLLDKKIFMNCEVYINANSLLKFMNKVFDYTNDWYAEEATEELSYNIDLLLEVIEYNDWEE
jgi:hypothetical protein